MKNKGEGNEAIYMFVVIFLVIIGLLMANNGLVANLRDDLTDMGLYDIKDFELINVKTCEERILRAEETVKIIRRATEINELKIGANRDLIEKLDNRLDTTIDRFNDWTDIIQENRKARRKQTENSI